MVPAEEVCEQVYSINVKFISKVFCLARSLPSDLPDSAQARGAQDEELLLLAQAGKSLPTRSEEPVGNRSKQ